MKKTRRHRRNWQCRTFICNRLIIQVWNWHFKAQIVLEIRLRKGKETGKKVDASTIDRAPSSQGCYERSSSYNRTSNTLEFYLESLEILLESLLFHLLPLSPSLWCLEPLHIIENLFFNKVFQFLNKVNLQNAVD